MTMGVIIFAGLMSWLDYQVTSKIQCLELCEIIIVIDHAMHVYMTIGQTPLCLSTYIHNGELHFILPFAPYKRYIIIMYTKYLQCIYSQET